MNVFMYVCKMIPSLNQIWLSANVVGRCLSHTGSAAFIKLTHPDCPVCPHRYQLSLVQSELLYRSCVTGASVFTSDLDFYQTSVPQQHVSPLGTRDHLTKSGRYVIYAACVTVCVCIIICMLSANAPSHQGARHSLLYLSEGSFQTFPAFLAASDR